MSDYSISNVRFTSADGKSRVHGWVYAPQGEIVGLLQITHGMCEYIGRYRWFMEAMAEQGFVVFGHDHIGHGDSSQPEEYGFFGEKDGWKHLVADVQKMSLIVREKYPNLPLYLFGHSMGSFVARLYLQKYGNEIDGAILSGTCGPNPMAKAGITAASAVIKLKGPLHRCGILRKMAFSGYNSKYKPQRTTHDWLTRDEAVVDTYLNDPKCNFCFTACGFRDLFTMVSKCNSREWFASLPKDLPILLISGDMDPVGGYGKGIEKVVENLLMNGMGDVSLCLYPEARHELLNESNKEEVLADVQFWLKERLPLANTETVMEGALD